MTKLSNLLLEGLLLYKIQVLIKTSADANQVFIYNKIRGLENVVVVTIEQNDYLVSKNTDAQHYSLLKMKYLASDTPKDTINSIKKDAMLTHKIEGLLQFIPRFNTIEKVGQY